MKPTIHAVLFDLDGTLADTALDLGSALNHLLRQHNLPEQPMSAIRPVASHGSAALIQLGANLSNEHPDFPQWRQEFLAAYDLCFDKQTCLFEGMAAAIHILNQRNIAWGIITNKPKTFTDRLVPKLAFPSTPATVVSGDTCTHAKPHTEPMFYACKQIGISPENCLYVGDAERDMQAGKNCGMHTVLAEWGYIAPDDNVDRWPADFKIKKPLQLIELLDSFT